MKKFSKIAMRLRKQSGMRQKDLADTLGISVSTVSNYETGVHYPDIDVLLKMAAHYQVSTDYLLGQTTLRRGLAGYGRAIPSGQTLGELFDQIDILADDDVAKVCEFVELLAIDKGN